MNEWIDIKDKEAPFGIEVEIKTASGEIRKDAMIPVGSYSVYWAGVSLNHKEEPTHWRSLTT